MWGFMKKLTDKDKEEKERKRKDKIDRKKVDNTLTADELIRLNEAQKNFNLKSSPTHSSNETEQTSPISSNSSLKKTNPPALQPKPSKKGIIKMKNSGGFMNRNAQGAQEESIVKKDIKNIISNFDKTQDQKPIQPVFKKTKPIPQIPKNAKPVLLSTGSRTEIPFSEPLIIRPDSPTFKSYPDLLPTLPSPSSLIPPKTRSLIIKRLQNGDLGLSLRKGVTVDRAKNNVWKQVIFLESKRNDINLKLGDILLEINNKNVEGLHREGVIEILHNCESEVQLLVRTVPELVLLSGDEDDDDPVKVSRSVSFKYQKAKTEAEVALEKSLLNTNEVWLVHKLGHSLCTYLGQVADGKVKVKTKSGQVLEVNEEDIQKACPIKSDLLEDLSKLRYLNESCLLHVIACRYYNNLTYTNAGFSLLAVNSMHPLSIYSPKIAQHYKTNKDVQAHIYTVAQNTYKHMMKTRKEQSIVAVGVSGSGKSFQLRCILGYYLQTCGAVNDVVNGEKLSAIWTLIDSFSTCQSAHGYDSSCCTHIITTNFDHNGQICSADLQAVMLNKRRLLQSNSFHIFSYFLSGLDNDARKDLHLDYLDTNHPYITFASSSEIKRSCQQQWQKVKQAFDFLNFKPSEVKAFCLVLSAIYHLGSARAVKGANSKAQFEHQPSAETAASLLGCSSEELHKCIFIPSSSASLHPSIGTLKLQGNKNNSSMMSPEELLEGFLMNLYAELYNCLISLINRSLSSSVRSTASIMLVDSPGFRPSSVFSSPSSSFCDLSDLLVNYTSERLQQLYHNNVFLQASQLYSQEQINVNFTFPTSSSSLLIDLLHNPPHNLLRKGSNEQLSSNEGLFWLLDDSCMLQTTNHQELLKDVLNEYSNVLYEKQPLVSSSGPDKLTLQHLNSSTPVTYDVTEWLKQCRHVANVSMLPLLFDSKRSEISELFSQTTRSIVVGGSMVGLTGDNSTLRRTSSIKRPAAVRKKSACLQVKFQVDSLIDTLRRMNTNFIHCLLPIHPSDPSINPSDSTHPSPIDLPLLRQQLRAFDILTATRLYKQGYSEHMSYLDFINKYKLFISPGVSGDHNKVVEDILSNMDVDTSCFSLGSSKLFLRSGTMSELEGMKEAKVSDWLITLQALCRRCLAKKKVEKLKIQNVAIACVQRNVRKLMKIRTWSWWRLYCKVQPLLKVQTTQEQMQDLTADLELARERVERLEREKNEFKSLCDQLQLQLSEVCVEAQEHGQSASHAADLLENETALRLQLEKTNKHLQQSVALLEGQKRSLESELVDLKLATTSLVESDDDDTDTNAYKERYKRLRRDNEFEKKRLENKHEEVLCDMEAERKIVEKKLTDLQREQEHIETQLMEQKKRNTKKEEEIADLKIVLEEQVSRNAQLEKKQRKFDSETAKLIDEIKLDRQLKDKLLKERDDLMADKITLNQTVKSLEDDLERERGTNKKLNRQIQEALETDKESQESWKHRQAHIEMEGKLAELEEEVDEQAATIQQLQQTKLRLEMANEKLRHQTAKEVEEREADLDDLKRSLNKKLRGLEEQLEEEYEERQKVNREKKELEKKLQSALQERPARDKDMEILLRKDLRRTKALLNDAQLVINKYQQNAGTRASIRQVKDQLEDAEMRATGALKAKKAMELEVADLHQQLDAATKSKNQVEERHLALKKELMETQSRLEENEEEQEEVIKKYKSAVQQHSLDLLKFEDQSRQIESLQTEREGLREELSRLQSRTEYFESSTVDKETIIRLEAKIRDLESKMDFEVTTRKRLEAQTSRLKEQLETEAEQSQEMRIQEVKAREEFRTATRKLKEAHNDLNELSLKESESSKKKMDLERKLEEARLELEQTQSDLHLAFKRINELTSVMESDLLNDDEDDDLDEDDDFDDDFDKQMNKYNQKYKLDDDDDDLLKTGQSTV